MIHAKLLALALEGQTINISITKGKANDTLIVTIGSGSTSPVLLRGSVGYITGTQANADLIDDVIAAIKEEPKPENKSNASEKKAAKTAKDKAEKSDKAEKAEKSDKSAKSAGALMPDLFGNTGDTKPQDVTATEKAEVVETENKVEQPIEVEVEEVPAEEAAPEPVKETPLDTLNPSVDDTDEIF